MSLLDVQDLTVSFDGKPVVNCISFQIQPGEKLALVGESGSGKTISALSLLRLVADAQTTGKALFGGQDLLALSEHTLRGIRGKDIAMIFQEPMTALNPLFTIGRQIAEVFELKQGLTQAQSALAAIEILASTGVTEPARRVGSYPHQLSGGQRQRAMIAMALACRPKLLLADEPTTALDVTVRGQILALLSDLQRQYGMAVLLITHDLHLVRQFADRVAVMERGRIVETGAVAGVFQNPQHAYTRKLIASKPVRDVVPESSAAPMLQAKALRVAYPTALPGMRGWFQKSEFVALQDASFAIPPGQTLGVVGESGSGKSTLALAVLGLQAYGGAVHLGGQTWGRDAAKNKALRSTIQVVFQDPFSSLSPRLTVEEIVGEGLRVHAPQHNAAERQRQVLQALADVGMDEGKFPGLLQRYPHAFSGGQRQRLAIARALIVQPQLLVLDEPTSALDVTIQQQVLQLLQRLQRERGLAYLLITHDMDVIRAMAHQVLVVQNGEIVESGPVAQVLDAPQHPYTRTLVAAST
ncbi:ABC transporter ATP-binding protein [Rhodoferax sp.]|uniref:ABC transporter ATP-binding protein n=1 Tax=Rhodoferax sp. TaxID=50421 RepID=UPI0025F67911|nr:dipeptide ABC transporter ATP-binding protein [Rhodoferax sp.]